MNNELSKSLKCICLRNGVELWIESEMLEKINFESVGRFLKIDDEIINTADIVGIFTAQTMEEKIRRKNGEWQCQFGEWHTRNQECAHTAENISARRIKEWEQLSNGNMKPIYK